MQFTLLQVIAIVLIALAVALAAWRLLNRKAPATVQRVEAAFSRAEMSVEGYTEAELVKLAGVIYARLSDDTDDLHEIAQADTDAAARKANANARLTQRAQARAKFNNITMSAKLSA